MLKSWQVFPMFLSTLHLNPLKPDSIYKWKWPWQRKLHSTKNTHAVSYCQFNCKGNSLKNQHEMDYVPRSYIILPRHINCFLGRKYRWISVQQTVYLFFFSVTNTTILSCYPRLVRVVVQICTFATVWKMMRKCCEDRSSSTNHNLEKTKLGDNDVTIE